MDAKHTPSYANDFMQCDTDENGNKIYTFSTNINFYVKWPWPKGVERSRQNLFRYTRGQQFGYPFLRAICDKNHNLLAYTHAMPIVPDPFPSTLHMGTWYAFETYNRELIKDFQITAYNFHPLDGLKYEQGLEPSQPDRAVWKYNRENNSYDLCIFVPVGTIDHCFLVTDKEIATDYGYELKYYKFNTVVDKPSPQVVNYMNKMLIESGIKSAPQQPPIKSEIKTTPKRNILHNIWHDIFQRKRG